MSNKRADKPLADWSESEVKAACVKLLDAADYVHISLSLPHRAPGQTRGVLGDMLVRNKKWGKGRWRMLEFKKPYDWRYSSVEQRQAALDKYFNVITDPDEMKKWITEDRLGHW